MRERGRESPGSPGSRRPILRATSELVDANTGRRHPLTMARADRELRREWMGIYRQVAADPCFAATPVRGAVTGCPQEAPVSPAAPAPAPQSPSCKVEVGANHIGHVPGMGDYYHLFVLYTDETGTTYYYRGGPSGSGLSGPSQASSGSSEQGSRGSSGSGSNPSAGSSESSGSSGSSSPSGGSSPGSTPESSAQEGGAFGYIHVMHGQYLPSTIDWDPGARRVTIAEGNNVCGSGARLQTALNAVGNSRTPYRPLGPNSNTTVYTVLRNAGFTPQVPAGVWAPGKDDTITTSR